MLFGIVMLLLGIRYSETLYLLSAIVLGLVSIYFGVRSYKKVRRNN